MGTELTSVLDGLDAGAYAIPSSPDFSRKFYAEYKPWGFQEELHKSTQRIAAAFCGNRCGKTTNGVMDLFITMTGVIPDSMKPWYPKEKIAPPGSNAWICTQTEPMIESIILPKIHECVPLQSMGITYQMQKKIFTLPDNKKIFLKSYEQGWESFQGSGIHYCLFDEECEDEKVYREALLRILSTNGYMRLTMTPLKGKTWVYYKIFERAKLEKGIDVFRAKMKDAPHLDKDAIEELLKGFPEHEKKARMEGEFTLAAEKRFFESDILGRWISAPTPSLKVVKVDFEGQRKDNISDMNLKVYCEEFDNIPVAGDIINADGLTKIWEPPRWGVGYVIGVDVASGEGSQTDHSVAHVKYKGMNGAIHHVATLRSNSIRPYEFGRRVASLARYYNNALIVGESEGLNIAFHAAIEWYPHVWRTTARTSGKVKFGLIMNSLRNPVLENERDLVSTCSMPVVKEYETLDEMTMFVYDDKGKPDHVSGSRSDGIMASSFADWIITKHPNHLGDRAPKEEHREDDIVKPRYAEPVNNSKRFLGNRNRLRRI